MYRDGFAVARRRFNGTRIGRSDTFSRHTFFLESKVGRGKAEAVFQVMHCGSPSPLDSGLPSHLYRAMQQ